MRVCVLQSKRSKKQKIKREIKLAKQLTAEDSGVIYIGEWETEEVSQWLGQLDLQDDYAEMFEEHEIRGDVLALLTDKHLKEVIVRHCCGTLTPLVVAETQKCPLD